MRIWLTSSFMKLSQGRPMQEDWFKVQLMALNNKGAACKHRVGRWAALFPLPAFACWPPGQLVVMFSSLQGGESPPHPTLLFPLEKSSANHSIVHCGWLFFTPNHVDMLVCETESFVKVRVASQSPLPTYMLCSLLYYTDFPSFHYYYSSDSVKFSRAQTKSYASSCSQCPAWGHSEYYCY